VIRGRLAALAVAAVVLLGAGVAAAVTYEEDDTRSEHAADTTTTTSAADTTTTSLEPTTTTAGGAATTTSRPARTTTTRPPSSTTSTTRSSPDCAAAQIEVTVRTDKPSYRPDEQVKVESTLRNRSSSPCFYAGHTFQVTIFDPANRSIIGFSIVTPGPERIRFQPTATITGSVPWDQRSCQTQPCPQPGPGTYAAAVRWTFAGGPYEARATFSLTG
jgi:hypothetical protein